MAHRRRDIAVTGQEDDRQMRSHLVQATLELGSAEPGYPDVEQDAAAAGVLGELREQLLPRLMQGYGIAARLQQPAG